MKAIIGANEFRRLIENTKRFVCNYGLMQYIYLEVNSEAKEIRATALDGHRISVEYASVEADESFKCFIKPTIPKITSRDRIVELELTNKKAFVTVQDNIMGYKQPEGEYYNVDKLLNDLQAKDITAKIGVNPKLLEGALKSIKGTNYHPRAKIEIRGSKDPIVIKSMDKIDEKNIKLVLPVALPEGGN